MLFAETLKCWCIEIRCRAHFLLMSFLDNFLDELSADVAQVVSVKEKKSHKVDLVVLHHRLEPLLEFG